MLRALVHSDSVVGMSVPVGSSQAPAFELAKHLSEPA